MRMMIAAAALVCASPACAEVLTIEQVGQLSAAGVGDEALIAKIRSSGASYDLTADQMLSLKKAGVSSAVMAAMLSSSPATGAAPAMSTTSPDPMVPHPAGIYLLDSAAIAPQMRKIDPILSSQAKTGGIIGSAMTLGIATTSIKVTIAGETSNIRTSSRTPIFYFFFDESNPGASQASPFRVENGPDILSPREFVLARLMKKDGRREARVGSINIAGAKTGVMDKDRAIFIFDRVRAGVFRIYPQSQLEPGEYGFVMPILGGVMGAGSTMARIFDFTVSP